MADVGKHNTLRVIRHSTSGVYLNGGEHGEILLPNRYVPERRLLRGDPLDVFVYRDSEDRLVATTEVPRAAVGDIATLKVIGVNPRFGAFLDWGLAKDLLLPFREQTREVRTGEEVTVRVYLDAKTHRIVASMRLESRAEKSLRHEYRGGEQVELLVTEVTDLGYKALVDETHPGLLYHDSVPKPLSIGQKVKGFVRGVRPDGKLDLTLQETGYKRVAPLSLQVVSALQRAGGKLPLDDNSSPDRIREKFGVSKKAFKQALGALYKTRRIRFTQPGIELLDNSTWSPGAQAAGFSRAPSAVKRASTDRKNEQANHHPKDHLQIKRQHGRAGESRPRFPRRSHSREQQGRE